MKNPFLIYVVFAALFIYACERPQEEIRPSNKDEDRVSGQLDLNNATIARLYSDFNTGVLYEYDNILDFAYVASSDNIAELWESVEIPQIRTLFTDTLDVMAAEDIPAYKAYTEAAVTFIDTTLFKYFKPNSKIAGLMPYKVLLSESVFAPLLVTGEPGSVMTESESRFSRSGSSRNLQRTVFNEHSIVFSVNQDEVVKDIDEYTKDNFYILLSRIMSMHNLYDEVPASFFNGKSAYYNQNMDVVYREELNIAEDKNVYVIDKDWFYSKGFIDAYYFFNSFGLRTYYQSFDEDGNRLPTRIIHPKALRPSYEFVGNEAIDVRSYLTEMIHRNEAEFLEYPENIQENIILLRDLLMSWGVDIVGINPDLNVLN
ncbi:hypothetical protein [Zhouia amylolytica]|nr:hypothetical protein [Zhouia amylolytica]